MPKVLTKAQINQRDWELWETRTTHFNPIMMMRDVWITDEDWINALVSDEEKHLFKPHIHTPELLKTFIEVSGGDERANLKTLASRGLLTIVRPRIINKDN